MLGVLVVAGLLTAAPGHATTPASYSIGTGEMAAFALTLPNSETPQYRRLSQAQQQELVAFSNDISVMDGAMTSAQVIQKYPGATVTDATGSDEPTASVPIGPMASGAATDSTTVTYEVHWRYHHTDTPLFLSNTASLDYYYTSNHKVTRDVNCTWHDSGPTLVSINNVSTEHYVSNALGYCDADVQLSEYPGFLNGYLDQDMAVNGEQAIFTYFHEHLP